MLKAYVIAVAVTCAMVGDTAEAAAYKTSKGRDVAHCHIQPCWARELTSDEIPALSDAVKQRFPNTTETAPATRQYNCHGYAHAKAHGWFNDPQMFMDDDYLQMTMAQPQIGDVVVYMLRGVQTHSAVVLSVNANAITRLESKWGQYPRVLHGLKEVPAEYGDPMYLLRRRVSVMPSDNAQPIAPSAIATELNNLQNPDTYFAVMAASTPAAARAIIGELDAVKRIMRTGQKAAPELVTFFQRRDVQENENLLDIVLVLLSHMQVDEAALPIKQFLRRDDLSLITKVLAIDAYLASKKLTPDEFFVDAAISAIERQ